MFTDLQNPCPDVETLPEPMTLRNAPIGTKARAFGGGHWVRVKLGWKWCTGVTFPTPGGDWDGVFVPPSPESGE